MRSPKVLRNGGAAIRARVWPHRTHVRSLICAECNFRWASAGPQSPAGGVGRVDYDARDRDPRIETDPGHAAERLTRIMVDLRRLPEQVPDLADAYEWIFPRPGGCSVGIAYTPARLSEGAARSELDRFARRGLLVESAIEFVEGTSAHR